MKKYLPLILAATGIYFLFIKPNKKKVIADPGPGTGSENPNNTGVQGRNWLS
ncbi:MAG: hypothetical protein HOP11_09575 [Saprospiraceae bacterium]|nr:hypothetical protein [Saprospiraceae bacterium]